MEIVDISHNDDLAIVARKCNANFKQLAFNATQQVRRQGRTSSEELATAISTTVRFLTETTIPNEVREQISALDVQGMVDDAIAALDIPAMVADEVAARIPDAYPPVGANLIMASDPAQSYPGTTWSQTDSIGTTGGAVIPLWQRTA